MHLILTKFDEQWVELTGLGGKLTLAVKGGIKPAYRRYDEKTQHWLVHWTCLPFLLHLARSHAFDVDYGTLPTGWQLRAAGAVSPEIVTPVVAVSPYAKLFVTEDAPTDVVTAAYRALVRRHHPDVGGDVHRFREVDDAYRRILSLRNSP
jgi:hypothetical protein